MINQIRRRPNYLPAILLLLLLPMCTELRASGPAENITLGPHLTPTDPALQVVKQQMTAQHWTALRLFPAQSFPLLVGGKPAGTLISGDAYQYPHESDKCFISLVEPGHPPTILATVENFQPARDIPACGSVRALGLLASPNPAQVRIGLLYYINAPIAGDLHGAISETEAVVLAFDRHTHQLTIDQLATDKATSANPENLPALAAALAP